MNGLRRHSRFRHRMWSAAVEHTLEANTHAFEWIWGGLGAAEKVAAAALAELGADLC
jgi:hypothetical protein